jgi:hypothetical protein
VYQTFDHWQYSLVNFVCKHFIISGVTGDKYVKISLVVNVSVGNIGGIPHPPPHLLGHNAKLNTKEVEGMLGTRTVHSSQLTLSKLGCIYIKR